MVRDGSGLAGLFDLIQSRYGWTDEVVRGLLYSRFDQLVKLLLRIKEETVKERLTIAAFIGFQMGAGGGKGTFGDYLVSCGLAKKPPQQPDLGGKDDTQALARMGIKVKKVKKQ